MAMLAWTPAVALALMAAGVGAALAAETWCFKDISVISRDMQRAGSASLLMLPFAVLGCIWAFRLTRARFCAIIGRMMLCYTCGYDLRGNPAAQTCPECGEKLHPTGELQRDDIAQPAG